MATERAFLDKLDCDTGNAETPGCCAGDDENFQSA